MIGVIGGMGPMATADFMKKLVEATPATRDCDHIPVIAQSLPQIPNRSAAILHSGPSPLPDLIAVVKNLKRAGALLVAMPCNTAHHWYDDLMSSTDLEIVHIVDAVCKVIRQRKPTVTSVGLMATLGTIQSGFYQERLATHGFDCYTPNDASARRIHEGIEAIKSNKLVSGYNILRPEVDIIRHQNINTIILGCTELPLVLNDSDIYVDSTQALASACVTRILEDFPLMQEC